MLFTGNVDNSVVNLLKIVSNARFNWILDIRIINRLFYKTI